MAVPSADVYPRFKLWISSNQAEGVFGDGKWRLLAAIDHEGSLRAACRSLGISYRKAWGDLRKAERCLGVRFLERHRGGIDGGSTALTDRGRDWLGRYGRFRARIERAAAEAFELHMAGLLKGSNKG